MIADLRLPIYDRGSRDPDAERDARSAERGSLAPADSPGRPSSRRRLIGARTVRRSGAEFRRRSSRRGYTLVEMMVAIVLLAVGITATMRVVSASTFASVRARNTMLAATLARQVLIETTKTADLTTGTNSGDFGEEYSGYQWESDVEESQDIEGIYQVSVRVTAPGDPQDGGFVLVMLVPIPDTSTSGDTSETASGGTSGGSGNAGSP